MKSKQKKTPKPYAKLDETAVDCFIAEEASAYGGKKPFKTYYENNAPYIRLLQGDCIEILRHAREDDFDCENELVIYPFTSPTIGVAA